VARSPSARLPATPLGAGICERRNPRRRQSVVVSFPRGLPTISARPFGRPTRCGRRGRRTAGEQAGGTPASITPGHRPGRERVGASAGLDGPTSRRGDGEASAVRPQSTSTRSATVCGSPAGVPGATTSSRRPRSMAWRMGTGTAPSLSGAVLCTGPSLGKLCSDIGLPEAVGFPHRSFELVDLRRRPKVWSRKINRPPRVRAGQGHLTRPGALRQGANRKPSAVPEPGITMAWAVLPDEIS
jgi:hypothetical protein